MTQEALFAFTRADGTRGVLRTAKSHGLEQLRAHLLPGYTVQVLPGADLVTLSPDTNIEQFKNLLAGVGSGYRAATYDDFGRSDAALGPLPNPVLQALGAKGLAPRRCILYLSTKGDTPERAPFLIDDTLDHFGVHQPPPALLSPLTPTPVRTRLYNDWRATISPIYLLPAKSVRLRKGFLLVEVAHEDIVAWRQHIANHSAKTFFETLKDLEKVAHYRARLSPEAAQALRVFELLS
jgi:hypothetical protein